MIRPLLILYLLRLHSLCLLKITIILTNILFLLRLLSLYLLSILILKNFMCKMLTCMSAFSTMNDRQTELPQPFYLCKTPTCVSAFGKLILGDSSCKMPTRMSALEKEPGYIMRDSSSYISAFGNVVLVLGYFFACPGVDDSTLCFNRSFKPRS